MKEFDTTNNQILDELIRRILQVVQPKRLILFGSAARGEMSSESDLDVLVVMPDGIHRRRTAQTIYRNLSGLGVTKDILVVTETDVKKHGEKILPWHSTRRYEKERNSIMPQDKHAPGSPEDWLARAMGDLALARVPLPDEGYYEALCFHAQQAAEKAIKAVYKKHDLTFRYTHDLGELLVDLKNSKRLAEVDFHIAEVSKSAVREKSIRHGHPS